MDKHLQSIRCILTDSIKIGDDKVLVIYDDQNDLTLKLTELYHKALIDLQANFELVLFKEEAKNEIKNLLQTLQSGQSVVLIQTSGFRLDDYRIRLSLFNKGIKVIEHLHLYRNTPDMHQTYLDSLAYRPQDQAYYHHLSSFLSNSLESCDSLEIVTSSGVLTTSRLEVPKINIGDYTNNTNTGGTYPIGEVFTEVVDFTSLNGQISLWAFANQKFEVGFCDTSKPCILTIKNGVLESYNSNTPLELQETIEMVKAFETPYIRELGFGINPAMSKNRYLNDITAFERIPGVHVSLGCKHSVYSKKNIQKHKARYHIDLFLDIVEVRIIKDGVTQVIFKDGVYLQSV
jgi:aminopeptidase